MDIKARIGMIPERLEEVRERIDRAAARVGRDADEVRIVAVTKTLPTALIEAAAETKESLRIAGLDEIGENRIQEGCTKIEELGREAATWHLIGHLQTNKARHAARWFDVVQSVDSPRIAAALQQRAGTEDRRVPIYLEVNTSGEASKYGVPPGELRPLLEAVSAHDRLEIQGLMTIAPFDPRESVVRPAFVRLRRLLEEAREWDIPGVDRHGLSMGMSGDFEWAVAEGATVVRLGSVLFGPRG